MYDNDSFEELKNFALNNSNYKKWRLEHTRAFGDLFNYAFSENEEAQLCLTAALINIAQKKFDMAIPKLDMLEKTFDNEFDETAVYYFLGLDYEMSGNEALMTEYYEKLKSTSVLPEFNLAFHPYYRTAKAAQRASECGKSMYYYRKALEFYDGQAPDQHAAAIASHLIYDIATLCLYMHKYDECDRFLRLSYQYDKSQNQQRDYVQAILFALQGNKDGCNNILPTLNPVLNSNCQAMTDAIFNGTDPHYCIVSQDRSLYKAFWTSFSKDEKNIKNMIVNGDVDEARQIVSQKLTRALGFMRRDLDCRIEKRDENIVIKCKNYWVKSLIEEHSRLFELKPEKLKNWEFVSVMDFESFDI